MALQVLVTRPADQAGEWVDALARHGLAARALPLLQIEPVADATPLVAAWHDLARQSVVLFVSPNAVLRFWASAPAGSAWPAGVRAAAPGPGTAQALRAHGVPADRIVQPPPDAAAFDSEHLWPLLQGEPWRGRSVRVVRGDGGREFLVDRWRAAGAEVQALQAYRRAEPRWDATQVASLAQALEQPRSHVWLLSSSQAIQVLAARVVLPAGARALATHPAIARTARGCGFSEVHEAAGGLAAVVACLESLG